MPVIGWTNLTIKAEEESKLRTIAKRHGLTTPRDAILYLIGREEARHEKD